MWHNLESKFVNKNAFGYSIYGPISKTWRFVDDGDQTDEIDWAIGLCGYTPCLKYAIRETTNTADILSQHVTLSNEPLPFARYNNGMSPGTTTGANSWSWVDTTIIVAFLLIIIYSYLRSTNSLLIRR